MKILIVDDDQKLCRLVADYLEPMGYDVEAAHNGIQGLQMILEGDYQAVILDVMRRKLGEDPRNPEFIQTVRAAGYMFKKPEDQQ